MSTALYALVGRPVSHSLSPAIHNPLFRAHGIDAAYILVEVPAGAGVRIPALIRSLSLTGANLTVPFKRSVLEDLDHVTAPALDAGAVNVVIRDGSRLIGDNTDAEGFARAAEAAFGPLAPRRAALVLGAGGAGRAVAAGIAGRGLARIHLLNRSLQRAEQAVRDLSRRFPDTGFAAGPLTAVAFADGAAEAGLVVNCTAGEATAAVAGLDLGRLPADAAVVDINYWMDDPPLLAAGRRCGLRTQDGLPMLVHQGALAFERFTGITPDVDAVFARLEGQHRR